MPNRTSNNGTRIFVVGCSRSGTTLIQRCLANNSKLCSFPETGFFRQLCGNKSWTKISELGIVRGKRVRNAFKRLYRVMPYLQGHNQRYHVFMSTSKVVNTFVNLLDNYSKQYNKSGWVEKTPQHFLNCATIHKYVPKVHVVYIIRDGFEVLGSLKDRYLKYPELFSRYSTPEIGI